MADLIAALCIATGVLLYVFLAGFSYPKFLRGLENNCDDCRAEYSCVVDHTFSAFWLALVWPLGLPLALGVERGDPDRLKRRNELLQARITELEKEAGLHG